MLEVKNFSAPTAEGARAQANEWLAQLPDEVRVLNVETNGGSGMRIWVLVPEPINAAKR